VPRSISQAQEHLKVMRRQREEMRRRWCHVSVENLYVVYR
jgi:hypothetical protein